MDKYFYVHQDHFQEYYPAKIAIDEENNVAKVTACFTGFEKNSIPAKQQYSNINLDERESREQSFEMKSLPPMTKEEQILNVWFSKNVITKRFCLRFITKEEKEQIKTYGGFVYNGPPLQDLQRIFSLLDFFRR